MYLWNQSPCTREISMPGSSQSVTEKIPILREKIKWALFEKSQKMYFPFFPSKLKLSVCPFVCMSVTFFQNLINQPNKVSSSRNFQHMSRLVPWVDYYCLWTCICAHACTVHVHMHATWGSKQIIIFQLNEVGILWNLVWLSRRYQ